MTNFIEEQQREWGEGYQQMHKSPTVEQWLWLETNVEATITNTLNHILESGLLEEKANIPVLPARGSSPSEYHKAGKVVAHNTLARDIKEFMSNMDKE